MLGGRATSAVVVGFVLVRKKDVGIFAYLLEGVSVSTFCPFVDYGSVIVYMAGG